MMDKYIGCEALLNALKEERKNGNFVFTSKWIKEIIDNLPSADVVPKSEVERLEKEKAELLVSKETDVHISMEKLVKVRTEHPIFKAIEEKVARGIFEEIEYCMKNFEDDDDGYLLKKCEFEFFMREIKEKYEEQKNG